MTSVATFLSAAFLAAPAGLNPYLPLLIVSVLARYTAERLEFRPPFGFMSLPWFMVLVGILFLADIFLDKMFRPGDSISKPPAERDRRGWIGAIHDLAQMILGPLSAALLMGASDRVFPSSLPLVAPMLGALLAALVYVAKRAWRQRLADRLGPFTNILLSTLEDTAVALLCVLGILLWSTGPAV